MILKVVDFEKHVKVDADCVINDESWTRLKHFVLHRDKHTCVYCGDKNGPFHIDHVMPKSRGGLNTEENLVCACAHCNLSKGARTPEEWGWSESNG